MENQREGMKRYHRDPAKFDLLKLIDDISRNNSLVIGGKSDAELLNIIKESLSRYRNPTMIHGQRVEAMFAYIVASLGKAVLIKKEDSGDVFTSLDRIRIPDYRIVLNDYQNKQILIEVKNYYQKKVFNEYSMSAEYLDSLSNYSKLDNTDLYIAIYWTQWSLWTLISPDDFEHEGTKVIISMESALKCNKMSMIGDYMIGTTPPLAIRIYTDKEKPQKIGENGSVEFVIGKLEMLCGTKHIANRDEQRIAFALMLFGGWEENTAVIKTSRSDVEIEYIEFSYAPQEYDNRQGFANTNFLSNIISKQYGALTIDDGEVLRLTPAIEPGMLGFVVPDGYKGDALPLWMFSQEPYYE